jgi:hypothetical protein
MISRRPMPARALLPVLCLFLFLITGCSAVVTDAEAPGAYKADTDWGVSTVVLSKDHTFQQTVRLKNGQTKQLHGWWKIDKNTGAQVYTTINLTPFYNVTHDKQGDYTIASAYSIYHVPFGGINFAADPDYGIAHRK